MTGFVVALILTFVVANLLSDDGEEAIGQSLGDHGHGPDDWD